MHKASFDVFQSLWEWGGAVTVLLSIRRHKKGEAELACTLDLILNFRSMLLKMTNPAQLPEVYLQIAVKYTFPLLANHSCKHFFCLFSVLHFHLLTSGRGRLSLKTFKNFSLESLSLEVSVRKLELSSFIYFSLNIQQQNKTLGR